ncbi:hypothetical protein EVAR_92147_1 [Eumeta japonica]|uniref:Uncharacterized protein n=1 Tax=Eumeta variegata TaxID=151549 RepID=A0A4C1SZ85_EUMVA|nr:hypothetical protein EVAR_92147_1 [Eumeta japonica]
MIAYSPLDILTQSPSNRKKFKKTITTGRPARPGAVESELTPAASERTYRLRTLTDTLLTFQMCSMIITAAAGADPMPDRRDRDESQVERHICFLTFVYFFY